MEKGEPTKMLLTVMRKSFTADLSWCNYSGIIAHCKWYQQFYCFWPKMPKYGNLAPDPNYLKFFKYRLKPHQHASNKPLALTFPKVFYPNLIVL